MNVKIETEIKQLDGNGRTRCLVRVLCDNELLVSTSVLDQPISNAANECLTKLEELVREARHRMTVAGLL